MNKKWILLAFILVFFIFPVSQNSASLPKNNDSDLNFNINIRSYFSNDQRIQWSGAEATFGTEAVLESRFSKTLNSGKIFASAEFRFNQEFDDNILKDEFREKYIQNFETDQFQIAQLFLGYHSKTLSISLGKKNSPFGNDRLLHLTNGDIFQPFIRTESILWRETGLFVEFQSGIFNLDIAVVNGGPEKDTNSSKAGILRAGLKINSFSFGLSAKMQDGIGSEWQKQYKNHFGFDLSLQSGNFRISAEGIYDEYGLKKDFNSDEIFWKRSLYYRDQFFKEETPITGIGGYIDLRYSKNKFTLNINYGEFHPEKIGSVYHDTPVKRLIFKILIDFSNEFGMFGSVLLENDLPREPVFNGASGSAYIVGFQYKI